MFKDLCTMRASDPEARGCLAVNSVNELVGNHETLGEFLETSVQQRVNLIAELIADAIEKGDLNRNRP
jgi:TetR/AcrR family transcriptional repressor of nem operon